MQDLLKRKEAIVKEHMTLMVEKQAQILDKMEKSLPDKKTQIRFGINLIDKATSKLFMNQESMLKMTGAERLQLAEIYSKNANNILIALNSDPGYASIIGNYDELIQMQKEIIIQINAEIAKAEDEDKRNHLVKEREKSIAKV
jgi:hypothetical protein